MAFNNSVEALNGIFGLLTKIEANTFVAAYGDPKDKGKKGKSAGAAMDIASGKGGLFGNLKTSGEGLKNTADGIKELTGSMTKFMLSPGKKSVINFIKDLNMELGGGKGSTITSKNFKTTSEGLLMFSQSISSLNKTIFGLAMLTGTGMTYLAMLGIKVINKTITSVGQNATKIKKGGEVLKDIGKTLAIYSLGLLAFGLSIIGVGALMGKAGGGNVFKGLALMAGTLGLFAGMFWLIGKADDGIKKGFKVIEGVGVSLAVLSLGLIAFALSTVLIGKLMGTNNPLMGLALVAGTILITAGTFWLVGKLSSAINKGTISMILMGVGLLVMSLGLRAIVGVAKMINELGPPKKALAVIGIAIGAIATVGLIMAGLGAAAAFIIPGTITAMLMGASLIVISKGIVSMLETNKKIEALSGGKPLKSIVSNMIEGVVGGVLDSFTKVLTGGKTGISAIPTAMKNTALLMTSIGLLMGVSAAFSMFAFSLSAFAKANAISPIIGYDAKGKPQFGPPVDISKSITNITGAFTLFLRGMIDITKNVDLHQTKVMKKLGKALTGDRGILSAVLDFAKVLEQFGKYGADGTIPSFQYNIDGSLKLGKDGKPIMSKGTTISQIVPIITKNFGDFCTSLAGSLGQITGKERRRMKKMSKALSGSIFTAVVDFAKVLESFAKYGVEGKIPILDNEGNPIKGKEPILIKTVADIVVSNFTTFVNSLATSVSNLQENWADKLDDLKDAFGTNSEDSIFSPVIQFSQVLESFAKYGSGTIAEYDKDGKATGKTYSIDSIVTNMTAGFTKFINGITAISNLLTNAKPANKSMAYAVVNMSNLSTVFGNLIKQKDGIEKTAEAIGKLGIKMGDFAKSVKELDGEKLKSLADISAFEIQAALEEKQNNGFGSSIINLFNSGSKKEEPKVAKAEQVQATKESNKTVTTTTTQNVGQPDWDLIAKTIGQQVGQAVAASFRNGQFTFEFAGPGVTNGIFNLQPK